MPLFRLLSIKDEGPPQKATTGLSKERRDVRVVLPLDPETPDCDYAARGMVSIWSHRSWAGER